MDYNRRNFCFFFSLNERRNKASICQYSSRSIYSNIYFSFWGKGNFITHQENLHIQDVRWTYNFHPARTPISTWPIISSINARNRHDVEYNLNVRTVMFSSWKMKRYYIVVCTTNKLIYRVLYVVINWILSISPLLQLINEK